MQDSINPTFTDLQDKLDSLQTQLDSLNNAVQPYQGDWIPINFTLFTYLNTHQITVTGFTPSDKFSLGDRIRIRQTGDVAGTYRYFFLTNQDATTISVEGGDNYVLANLAIIEIAYSKIVRPTGFPGSESFVQTLPVDFSASSRVYTNTSKLTNFYMIGNKIDVTIDYQVTVNAAGGGSQFMYHPLPVYRTTQSDIKLLTNSMTGLVWRNSATDVFMIAPVSSLVVDPNTGLNTFEFQIWATGPAFTSPFQITFFDGTGVNLPVYFIKVAYSYTVK